jgi:mRNA interferase MazF
LAERPYCPDAGDIVWIDFNPQRGREQTGRRPALVLSPRAYNRKAQLCVLCAMTNQAKGYPFEVTFPPGFPVTGVVLADQVKSFSWEERKAQFWCEAPMKVRLEVASKLRTLLQL